MINPFRDKLLTDEQYQHECDRYEEKHQCMLRNNIHILTNLSYQFFVDYVEEKYGKDHLKQFKNNDKCYNSKI